MKNQTTSRQTPKKLRNFILFSLALTVSLFPFYLPPILAQATRTLSVNRPILRLGSEGIAVSELQATLKLLGYYTGDVNGIFDQNTAKAVTEFQQAAGLKVDGIVGRATWERLFPRTATAATVTPPTPTPLPSVTPSTAPTEVPSTSSDAASNNSSVTPEQPQVANLPNLKLGASGPAVFWLQKRLQTTGFFQGSVDGIFGSDTELAVKAAQERYGLRVDGIVGKATWRSLLTQP